MEVTENVGCCNGPGDMITLNQTNAFPGGEEILKGYNTQWRMKAWRAFGLGNEEGD